MDELSDLLARFPKTRPPLDPRIEQIYASFYKNNRDGTTLAASSARRIEKWLHKKVALLSKPSDKTILEIGAGNLNHIPFETRYQEYDVVEPMMYLYADSPYQHKINHFYTDISSIDLTRAYDRIISITAFEHILNLPEVIKISAKLLKQDGDIVIAIPSEGYFLWGLAWRLTTGLEFRLKYHLDYGNLMRYEHVNSADEVKRLLEHAFGYTKTYRFGISNHFSLFQVIHCKNPILANMKSW